MLKLALVALALLFIGSIADVPTMFLAVRGALPLGFVLAAGFLADVIPDFFWYWLGGKIGVARFERLPFLKQKPERMEAIERAFEKYGAFILFGSKFVYAFGIPSQITAGAHRFDLKKMFLANALGSAGWLAVLYVLARTFNSELIIETHLHSVELGFTLFFAASLILYFAAGFVARRIFGFKK
jgi:membrane protein DedA with SNARE-associated domain